MGGSIAVRYIIFGISVTLMGCYRLAESVRITRERKIWEYDKWEQNFKDKVLCDCLVQGAADSAVARAFYNVDKSFYPPINAFLFDSLSRELLRPVIKEIRTDSINSLTSVAEAAQGKRVFRNCLLFYKSKRLDSITRAALKNWVKVKDIDSLVLIKNPSY